MGKLQGPENKHGPKWSRKCKSNLKMVVLVALEMMANVWEVTSLKTQNGQKMGGEVDENSTAECLSVTPRCECIQLFECEAAFSFIRSFP